MTAALMTHPRLAVFGRDFGLSAKPTCQYVKYAKQDGSEGTRLEFKNLPVFRSGTFADSMGIERTWEPLHIQQMKDTFDHLTQRRLFDKVPIRKGHGAFFGEPMDGLVGWHSDIRIEEHQNYADLNTYQYIMADGYLFDPEAMERFNAGDWPNRSSEVGPFVTNAQAEYYPTYMGFAFVDIPAVEGLNFSRSMFAKQAGVTEETQALFDPNQKEFGVAGTENPPPPSAAPHKFTIKGVETTNPQSVEAYIAELEAAGTPAPFEFTMGGNKTSDFAAVQAHVNTLEATLAETEVAGRNAYVASLASGATPKIAAAQVEGLQGIVKSMDPTSFAAFKKSYDDLPGNPLFARHGVQTSPAENGGQQAPTPANHGVVAPPSDADGLASVLANLKRVNPSFSKEQFEAMPTYKKLAAVDPQRAALAIA